MRRSTWRVLSTVLPIALISISVALASSEENLAKLDCVRIVVEDMAPEARKSGLTEESLSSALLVALKSKMPLLRIDDSCAPWVYLNITFVVVSKGEAGQVLGFASNIRLEVYRDAYIRGIDRSSSLNVWDVGGLFVGPKGGVKTVVLENLNDYVTQFAAAYYKAGNA